MSVFLESPFFSIVIPLYNKEKYIKATLESVLKQTYSNFEVVIINDGSTDSSCDYVLTIKDSRIRIVHQNNKGVSTARNNGIKKSKGKYIVLLDADDLWLPNHLQDFKNAIKKYPLEFVFGNNYKYKLKENSYKPTYISNLPEGEDIVLVKNYFKCSLPSTLICASSVCIQKDILKDDLVFNEELTSGEDTDLWIRLGLKYPFVFNKNIGAIYNKEVLGSLSSQNNINSLFKFTQNYIVEEKSAPFLKKFMDANRFDLMIKSKIMNRLDLYEILKNQIDCNSFNVKQKLLLRIPVIGLRLLINFKKFLEDKKIHLLIYK